MSKKTVLITGGAGFIGSNFVRAVLRDTDWKVVNVDKLTYAGSLKNLEDIADDPRYVFSKTDITDAAAIKELFETHRPDYVANFAAETHVDRSIDGPGAFVQTNVVGTFVLLQAARELYDGLEGDKKAGFRFLHVSTDEVYGSLGDTGLFEETTPYSPRSPYSASKAGADHLVSAYYHSFNLPAVITNCSNNYGPYQFPEKLIPLMILNAVGGKKLPIYGDGGNIRDWLHVEDHCSGILLALTKGQPGEKYNIGGNNERTNLQVIDKMCEAIEKYSPAAANDKITAQGMKSYIDLKSFVKDRPGHDRRYAIDATKIRKELGWKPRYDFESGIDATVKWYLDNQDWCDAVKKESGYEQERLGLK